MSLCFVLCVVLAKVSLLLSFVLFVFPCICYFVTLILVDGSSAFSFLRRLVSRMTDCALIGTLNFHPVKFVFVCNRLFRTDEWSKVIFPMNDKIRLINEYVH